MDERQRIEAAIRASLESGLSTGVGGVLGDVARIAEATDVPYGRDQVVHPHIRHLEVVHLDDDTATANLDATLVLTATLIRTGAPLTWEVLANGPVELRREDGNWLIHDLALDGLRASDTRRTGALASGGVEGAEVRASLAALITSQKSATLFVDVENQTDTPLRMGQSAVAVRRRIGFGWRWSAADHAAEELPVGTTRLQVTTGAGGAQRRRAVRLLLATNRGALDVRPAGTRRRRRLPLFVRRPTLAWTAVVTAVAGAMAWLTTWSLAGLLLFTLSGAGVLALISSPDLVRRHPAFVLSRMSAFVVGLGLFVWPYLFPPPTVDAAQAESRLVELLRERGIRPGADVPQPSHAFASAWDAFEEFADVRLEGKGDHSLSFDVFMLAFGTEKQRDSSPQPLLLSFTRYAYLDDGVREIELTVRVPRPATQRLLATTVATPCGKGERCLLRCTYGPETVVGAPCRLRSGPPNEARRTLRAGLASSVETGPTADLDDQRARWIRFVEGSYIFREVASLPGASLRFDVSAKSPE